MAYYALTLAVGIAIGVLVDRSPKVRTFAFKGAVYAFAAFGLVVAVVALFA